MFEGFQSTRINTGETDIQLVMGGRGPALLLLHGYPQSHVAWYRVAPALARHFSVVAPDLRGYGDSGAPEPDPGHTVYSKRAMARDMVAVMRQLGFERFGLAGHDRGGRVAYRLALDYPEQVSRLAVLDMVPTLDMLDMVNAATALDLYHWFFLAQPAPLPETMIGRNPDFYLKATLESWLGWPDAITASAMAEYRRCFRRASVIRAACEDYRAGLTVDAEADRADRAAGRRIRCPVLALWGDDEGRPYDPLEVWRRWAGDVRGTALACGHFLMEEAPDEITEALAGFFAAS